MQKEKKQRIIPIAAILLVGVAVGAIVCALTLLLLSVAFSVAKRAPQVLILPLAVCAAGIGAFAAGFTAARLVRRKGYLFGLAEGLLLFAATFVCGIAATDELATALSALKLGLMLLAGMVGGIVGVNRKRKLR